MAYVSFGSEKYLDALLEKIKPVIYIPKEDASRTLIDVIYEKKDGYYVLWYHWPFDGHFTQRQDYEPVILVVQNNTLRIIGVRPHYSFNHSNNWDSEENRPVVIFTTDWHGPYAGTSKLMAVFKNSMFSDRLTEYDLKEGKPPEWSVSAGMSKSIYEYAEELVRGLES